MWVPERKLTELLAVMEEMGQGGAQHLLCPQTDDVRRKAVLGHAWVSY